MGLGVRGVKGLGDLDARGRLIKHKLLFVQHAKSGGAWRGGGETGRLGGGGSGGAPANSKPCWPPCVIKYFVCLIFCKSNKSG